MMPTAIVTGGAGFIGSHLTTRLLTDGYRVRVIDNFVTGRRANLEHVAADPALEVIELDIADSGLAATCGGADVIFHLAGLADIVPSIERPEAYHQANVNGTFNVMQAARAAGVARVLYAASSSCYGVPAHYPTPEGAAVQPRYPYALTKYLGECIVMHWGHVYGIKTTSLRLFNVYGPRSRTSGTYGAVFGVFLAQKIAGQPFTVVGDGSQTRDFTYVSDVVDAFVTAAACASSAGEIMNVGSGKSYSINWLVELLGGPVTHVPKRPGEPDKTFADVAKIEDFIGWRAGVSLETGVATMLEHLDDWRDAPIWSPESIERATRSWFTHLQPAVSGAESK